MSGWITFQSAKLARVDQFSVGVDICIRDGQLKVTEKHPFAGPTAITSHQVEIAAQQREALRRTRLDEARSLLVQSSHPAAWLASMTASGAGKALALLDALDAGMKG